MRCPFLPPEMFAGPDALAELAGGGPPTDRDLLFWEAGQTRGTLSVVLLLVGVAAGCGAMFALLVAAVAA